MLRRSILVIFCVLVFVSGGAAFAGLDPSLVAWWAFDEGAGTIAGGSKYVVQRGDTLWQLARRFSMTVDELTSLNRIGRESTLKPGQELVIASN